NILEGPRTEVDPSKTLIVQEELDGFNVRVINTSVECRKLIACGMR
ncbi:unnamed protein product, partial [Callosobruchus maculatus]